MTTHQVWDLEVFGNDIDGFEVDSWKRAGKVELREDISDDEIVSKLVEEGHLNGYSHGRCSVDQQDRWIYIYELISGRPLFNLEMIEV